LRFRRSAVIRRCATADGALQYLETRKKETLADLHQSPKDMPMPNVICLWL
jgi:hypothetical protein